MTDEDKQRPWLKLYPEEYPADFSPPDISARDMFEQSVSRSPQVPAIHYFDSTLSYAEVDSLAGSMAAGLADLGVEQGDRVIVQLQNMPQFLIATYACWKLGAIVVPLNPMYKERELEFYCNDSTARLIITMEDCYPEVNGLRNKVPLQEVITTSGLDFLSPDCPVPAILKNSRKEKIGETIDMVALLAKYQGAHFDKAAVTPGDIAYLTYTSGTTGPAKGAMNTHGGIVFSAHAIRALYCLGKDDKIIALAPFIHVTGSVTILATASLAGIPVITFFRFEPGEVLRLTEKWRATMSAGPPTVYISLLSHPDLTKRDISSLEKINSGGASIAPGFVEKFEEVTGKYIHNGYGLTETTAGAIVTPLGYRGPVDSSAGALSIGLPISGTIAKVVDGETGADLPPNKEGEVAIKGPAVIPGYWNKPQETANAIKDGWLYTGDIGKMDENGWFYIIDRKKDLINASGFKVWPREIEDILYTHPAVRETCVIGMPDPYRGETVKAFIVLNEGYQHVTPEELIEFCRGQMAAYKYPRAVEIIPEIPKTVSGKMLRRQLREEEAKKRDAA
ncbi:class I adenylate-forming enzyme family protein [Chloroflexota bacterium]